MPNRTTATAHILKTWPEYFFAIESGKKKFEVRKDDRNFHVEDWLILQEWCPKDKGYTGAQILAEVTCVVRDEDLGLKKGYVVLGIKVHHKNGDLPF